MDQQPAACAVANLAAVNPTAVKSGGVWTATESYTITNAGSEALTISGKAISLTWARPDADHDDMVFTAIVFGNPSTTDNFSNFAPGTKALAFPAHLAGTAATGETYAANTNTQTAIAAGGTYTLQLRWQYKKKDTALPATPNVLTKLCIAYTIPSESTTTKFCNIVGQAASTNNPNACD